MIVSFQLMSTFASSKKNTPITKGTQAGFEQLHGSGQYIFPDNKSH
jgi:hypothetical protein